MTPTTTPTTATPRVPTTSTPATGPVRGRLRGVVSVNPRGFGFISPLEEGQPDVFLAPQAQRWRNGP